jgi:hypothetical protein
LAGDNGPPLFGTWKRAYGVVLGTLVVVIALCAWLTRIYE